MKNTVKLCAYVKSKKAKAFSAYAKLNKRTGPKQLEFLVDCVLAGVIELPDALSTLDRAPEANTERRAA